MNPDADFRAGFHSAPYIQIRLDLCGALAHNSQAQISWQFFSHRTPGISISKFKSMILLRLKRESVDESRQLTNFVKALDNSYPGE
jgi:hypothetical protein